MSMTPVWPVASTATWLYALGDANHRALLTHQGKYQARMAGNAIGARAHGNPLDTAPWGAPSLQPIHTRCPRSSSRIPRPHRSA